MSELQKELLPCPFCGGEAVLEQTGKRELTIKCKSCITKRTQRVLRYSLEWLEQQMVDGWNKRVGLEQKLKEACKEQREICADKIPIKIGRSVLLWGKMDLRGISNDVASLYEDILNAPEPELKGEK